MTGPPGAVQAGGNWGLGTGDTPTWPGASNGAWPAGRKTKEKKGTKLGSGVVSTQSLPNSPGQPSPESSGCTKAGPLGPNDVKPRATELVGPYEVTVPA